LYTSLLKLRFTPILTTVGILYAHTRCAHEILLFFLLIVRFCDLGNRSFILSQTLCCWSKL